MNTFETAEILLKEAILLYEKHGITHRVSCVDIAKDKNIDINMAENAVNHLFFLKLIKLDSGGNYYLDPEKLHDIMSNFQNQTLSKIIINTNVEIRDETNIIVSDNKNQEDIIDVKPNIFGLGININACYRKLKNSISRRRSN